jgi:hypothetical protein
MTHQNFKYNMLIYVMGLIRFHEILQIVVYSHIISGNDCLVGWVV